MTQWDFEARRASAGVNPNPEGKEIRSSETMPSLFDRWEDGIVISLASTLVEDFISGRSKIENHPSYL